MFGVLSDWLKRRCAGSGRIFNRFKSDDGGNIALTFGLTIIPAIIVVGAAVDYSRGAQVKTALQTALDSTALHIALLPDSTSQTQLETSATEYFDANYQGDVDAKMGNISVIRSAQTVTLQIDATMTTLFMGVANVNNMEINALSEVLRGGGTIEVAVVLDNSGSMRGTKLKSLKNASTGLVETLFDGLSPGSTDLSFSLVPFATFVDVGESHANDPWIDRFAQSSIHSENFSAPANRFDLFNNIKNAQWQGCVEARPYPYDVQDTPPTPATPDTLFVPAFAPDTPSNGGWTSYNNYLPDKKHGSWISRQEYLPKYAPGVWANTGWFGTRGPSYLCNQSNLMPLTTSQSTVKKSISNMAARGNTNIAQGLAWGWRTLSPGEPFTEGRAYSDDRNQKILILLTDGQNWISGNSGPNKSRYSAYGFAKDGRLGTVSGSNVKLTSKMNERTAETCTNIKAAGITVYTIVFNLNDKTTQNLIRNCASSPDNYYNSPSSSQLDKVFDDIAKKLQMLRLSR